MLPHHLLLVNPPALNSPYQPGWRHLLLRASVFIRLQLLPHYHFQSRRLVLPERSGNQNTRVGKRMRANQNPSLKMKPMAAMQTMRVVLPPKIISRASALVNENRRKKPLQTLKENNQIPRKTLIPTIPLALLALYGSKSLSRQRS